MEKAVAQSGIDELLTKDDFYHAFAYLRKGQRSLQARGNAILAILHRIEPILSADRSQEPSAEELQSIREQITKHLHRQIAKEKNSKRYIPDVFVEVARVKDKARFFAHPVLFLNKAIKTINRLNFSALNRILSKLSHDPVCLDLPDGFNSTDAIDEVENHR